MKLFFKSRQTSAITFFLLSGFALSLENCQALTIKRDNSANLQVLKKGKNLEVIAIIPGGVNEVEVRLISSRNQSISRFTDVSQYYPKRLEMMSQMKSYKREIWYPVVDIVLEPGMEGVALFDEKVRGKALINGPFHKKKHQLENKLVIAPNDLEIWENSIVVEPADNELREFYLQQRLPVVARTVQHCFSLLSESWQGRVEIFAVTEEHTFELASEIVADSGKTETCVIQGKGLERERLVNALRATVEFTLRCQIRHAQSPMNGGLFLFYELEATTYRNSYWPWGWGPSVRLLLDAAEVPELGLDSARLRKVADEIGRASLRFKYYDVGHPLHEVPITRWAQNIRSTDVYHKAITIADAQFLSGWAWISLFETTRDSIYFKAAENLCRVTAELMESFDIIPHSYWPGNGAWSDFTYNETGFGTEGLAEIFRVTGDIQYRETGRKFIEQHLTVFQRDDGLWERNWNLNKKTASPTEYLTRGLGWSMEGLLAVYRLIPEKRYLDLAVRMAENLIESQQPSGYWPFYFDRTIKERGISEKGTALWSYLFYRLYAKTRDKRHLKAARKALTWCLDNQYTGPDPEAYGSIVGLTQHSAVSYRKWFHVSCIYTSGFFGLAILEELKLE